MTLIEAIKIGRPFKRLVNDYWCVLNVDGDIYYLNGKFGATLNKEDIIASDWEIEEEKIELTEIQVEDAVYNNQNYHGVVDVNGLLTSLGFKS